MDTPTCHQHKEEVLEPKLLVIFLLQVSQCLGRMNTASILTPLQDLVGEEELLACEI